MPWCQFVFTPLWATPANTKEKLGEVLCAKVEYFTCSGVEQMKELHCKVKTQATRRSQCE
jgi:hypothetical protein